MKWGISKMENSIRLRAGIPNDRNRDYLPEAIYHSKMVVNENGNNSQPYPERLMEFHEEIVEKGKEDVWFEYVPESYDGSEKVPLIISLHGGLMTGWGQAVYSSWTMVADRNNCIIIFPNASSRRMWLVEYSQKDLINKAMADEPEELHADIPPENPDDNHDIRLILNMIDRAKEKYNIDEGRIFVQGMSAGNLMGSFFARYYGNRITGLGESAGPTFDPMLLFNEDGSVHNFSGPMAVWQTRPEKNGVPDFVSYTDLELYRYNREYWLKVNKCDPVPEISIHGENNMAFYEGEGAPFVYLDVKNRDHGQTFDEAFLQWDYLFSGIRRLPDGRIEDTGSRLERKGDSFNVALYEGTNTVFFNNELIDLARPIIRWQKLKYHGQNGKELVRGDYIMVPLSFIARCAGAQTEYADNGEEAEVTLADGRKLQFATGSIGCVIDNDLRQMYCEAIYRYDELYISFEWFARMIMGWHCCECDGIVYVTDHYAELSINMADLIKDLLCRDMWSDIAVNA